MWDAIQGQRLPNDVGIGTEPVLPERVRQNHDRLNLERVIDRFVESRAARERHAEHLEVVGGDKRQQHRFEEQMSDQLPPSGAESGANRQLALAVGAADQHHAGDVQAHDEKHRSRQCEPDGLNQRELGTDEIAHTLVRLSDAGLVLVRLRVLFG